MFRRRYLALAATAFAGCSAGPSGNQTTESETQSAPPTVSPSPTTTPLPRSAFSAQLSNELESDGPNGSVVSFEQDGLAFIKYFAADDAAEQLQEAVREAYTAVVDANGRVGRDLEGRVKHESDGTKWYTYMVKEQWAQAYLAGDLSESEFAANVESSRSKW